MIKTVLLDLDDMIFDFKECERQALAKALAGFFLAFSPNDLSEYSQINDRMWKMLERGEITREELKTKRFEVFLSRYSSPPDAMSFAARYMQELSQTSALIDGARSLLEHLSQTYDLYAVTNGYEFTQMGRMKSADILKYFKKVFISENIGVPKPKKEYFDRCVAEIPGFCIKNTVIIGDSPTSDIAGGKAYGLFTIRFNPHGDPNPPTAIPDREVRSLGELAELLASL